ncbi:MAG: radical SAM protein [Puia sp.]|nr:radical SAM protein [Puia sp.]
MDTILFTHSYFLRFDPKQWRLGQPYPPLGTLYAAALMREKGFRVGLFDTMFAESPDEILEAIEHHHPRWLVIYDDGFNYLTKMCLTNMREAAFRMSRLAKEKGCRVVVSSSDSTDHFVEYLEQGADFVVIGEGEQTLLELIGRDGGSPGLPGLAFLRDGLPVKTGGRAVMKDLDALPLPAWDLVEMERYRATWMRHAGYFSLNMSTTRGCPFKCNWCAKPIYGNRYHARSPGQVVNEMKWLKERYAFQHIWFCDDIFGLKPGWVSEFADLLEQEGLRIPFKIQSRADLLLQEDYVRALARAGCENSWMGAESGSQRILDAMDKGTTVEQIEKATGLLKTNGIRPSFFIQFGYPGETKEDIRKTLRMINELLPDEIGISVSYPLPGTVFYEKVKADLSKKANWTDSDELQIMFRNTYAPPFYKQLHRYVHLSYRLHKALHSLKSLLQKPGAVSWLHVRKAVSLACHTPALVFAKWKLDRLGSRSSGAAIDLITPRQ